MMHKKKTQHIKCRERESGMLSINHHCQESETFAQKVRRKKVKWVGCSTSNVLQMITSCSDWEMKIPKKVWVEVWKGGVFLRWSFFRFEATTDPFGRTILDQLLVWHFTRGDLLVSLSTCLPRSLLDTNPFTYLTVDWSQPLLFGTSINKTLASHRVEHGWVVWSSPVILQIVSFAANCC